MTGIAMFKERLKGIYGQYSGVINMGIRLLLALIVLLSINNRIGFSSLFSNIFVILIMAILSALTSIKALVFFSALTVFADCMSLGWDIGLLSLVIMLVLLIVFVIFVPDDASAVIITPLGIMFGIPAFVSIAYGLKRSPACIAAVWPGIVMYHFIDAVQIRGSAIQAAEAGAYLERVKMITDEISGNGTLLMHLVACAAVVIMVYAIRRLSADFSWHIAVVIGGALYLIMCILCSMAINMNINLGRTILSVVISIVIGFVFLLFVHNVDYSMSERLTFEDDDYYYYVKAVPKSIYTAESRKVTTISPKGESTGPVPADIVPPAAGGTVFPATTEIPVASEGGVTAEVNLEEKLEDSLEEL